MWIKAYENEDLTGKEMWINLDEAKAFWVRKEGGRRHITVYFGWRPLPSESVSGGSTDDDAAGWISMETVARLNTMAVAQ